jgi:predicted extracellular nuclease
MIRSAFLVARVSFACFLAVAGAATAQFEIQGVKFTKDLRGFEHYSIMQIQWVDQYSPLTAETVQTAGVVTGVAVENPGYWIQDPKGDGDPATSDGLFVVWGGKPPAPPMPKVGDMVQVIGKIQEVGRGIEFPRTQMQAMMPAEVLSQGNPLPEPVVLSDLPDVDGNEGVKFWEALEGMRATVQNAAVVGPTTRFGEFAVLTPGDAVPGSGYYPKQKTLLLRNLGGDKMDYNPERIVVGDHILGKSIAEVRPGDEASVITGVVDYSYNHYKIEADRIEMKVLQPPAKSPVSVFGPKQGSVSIADLNMAGFFDEVDDPETFDENNDPTTGDLFIPDHQFVEDRIGKFALAMIDEMRLPDVVMMQEFETQEIIQRWADRVNAKAGTRYKAVSIGTSDRRGLEAGFLYDEKRVELVEYYQLKGDDVDAAFGLKSPFRNREPIVGVFRFSPGGPPVTIFDLKLKSKRQDPPTFNLLQTPVRPTERQRHMQARVVRHYVDEVLKKDPNALVLVGGDFGDIQLTEPGEGTNPVAIIGGEGSQVKMASLLDLAEEGTAYTWIYHGNGQALSHMLASPALRKLFIDIDALHFNSPLPNLYGADPNTAIRCSDRDPIQASFNLRPARK